MAQALRSAIPMVVLRSAVERLRARGARIRENGFAPGDRREVEFSADAELLIHRLGGLDLTGAERVDVRITAESTGALVSAVEAVPFDPAEGAVFIACQRHYVDLPHDTVMSVSIHPTGAAAGAPAANRDVHDPPPISLSRPGASRGVRVLGVGVGGSWTGDAGATSAAPRWSDP